MGAGSWTSKAFVNHSTRTRGFSDMDSFKDASAQELYKARTLEKVLNPYKVIRECCDSEEHPNTVPVILALDVTGSMGSAAQAVAKQLNDIMTGLYDTVKDVEFMIMAIGDLSYDDHPIQASQFESDIRIAEQLEKVYFEGRGGGNTWESYSAAWYFGINNTKLDCWKRGKKGIIITMGDESLNPYLPKRGLEKSLGCKLQDDINTGELYIEAVEKFDIYHISIDDSRTSYRNYKNKIENTFNKVLGQRALVSTCDKLPETITNIIVDATSNIRGRRATLAVDEASELRVTDEGLSW